MAFLKMSGLVLAAAVGLSLPTGQAKAMPANGLAATVKQVPQRVEQVAWCGRFRCWSTGWGWRRPYAYWGWRRPYAYWGWRRPLYAYAGPAWGWRRPLYAYAGGPYWGWRRPFLAAAVTTGIGFNPWYGGGFNPWYGGAPYAYVGWNTGWRGWGMNTWW